MSATAKNPEPGTVAPVTPEKTGRELPPWAEKGLIPAIVFGYLVIIMVFRPSGLLGEETREAG